MTHMLTNFHKPHITHGIHHVKLLLCGVLTENVSEMEVKKSFLYIIQFTRV